LKLIGASIMSRTVRSPFFLSLRLQRHLYLPFSTTVGTKKVPTEVSTPSNVQNFINGVFEDSAAVKFIELRNPATQELICLVPESTPDELKRAEEGAKIAFKTWREVPVQHRQRVMQKFLHLIRENTEELAHSISSEQGKTLADARGDVFRGTEVVEQACSVGHLMLGDTVTVSKGLDQYTYPQKTDQ
jgi:malonate-semialdehyde dehydrogenase (acetylating)/methylmalonate-semialdehyde dehydrogenase